MWLGRRARNVRQYPHANKENKHVQHCVLVEAAEMFDDSQKSADVLRYARETEVDASRRNM